MSEYGDDYLASDDPTLNQVLLKRTDSSDIILPSSAITNTKEKTRCPLPSSSSNKTMTFVDDDIIDVDGNWLRKLDLERQIAEIDAHVFGIRDNIKNLNVQLTLKEDQREGLMMKLREIQQCSSGLMTTTTTTMKRADGVDKSNGIDYMNGEFDWMGGLKARMKSVFGISEFRLCQRGICNANMDGRDIVVVMPTGGGKSLTYQLPALLTPGCTLVISPLISLITDQILHLQKHAINAAALTGATPSAQKKEIHRQLTNLAERRLQPGEEEIKLCYVTPERVARDTHFVMLLQKLMMAGKLARVVIDEAHCVSQMGHDFRPDYQKLHRLRQMLPSVPIMALSATCPPLVLKDLLKTLSLPDIVDGRNAKSSGTVYFFSPLYRKNLHYRVVPKPSKASDVTKEMVDYILEHHPNDSGIVYCLSKKNSETVAQELQELSDGKIRTGVYHADRQGNEKNSLHQAWRQGKIKVVCATIAFGLGIDKGDVRFVLHHSMSKSLEGYYQESGRAGRDGKDADCVLYYRPQDGSTISSMVFNDKCGTEKLHAMLDYAEDLEECRKIQFAKYFSHSSNLSISSWSTEDQDVLERCGHCDNCTRPPETIECRDVSLYSWQLLQIVHHIHKNRGKATVNMLAGLARNAGGAFDVSSGRKRGRKEKEKVTLALDDVAGGTVDLSRNNIEHLIIRLLIKGYFTEEYQQTAYTANVYIVPGPLANRFIHATREDIERATRPMIQMTVPKHAPKARRPRKKCTEDVDEDRSDTPVAKKRKTADDSSLTDKGKGKQTTTIDIIDFDDMDLDNADDSHSQPTWKGVLSGSVVPKKRSPDTRGADDGRSECEIIEIVENVSDEDSDEVVYEWSTSLRQEPTARRKRIVGKERNSVDVDEGEVLVVPSD